MKPITNIALLTAGMALTSPAALAAGGNPWFDSNYWAIGVLILFLLLVWRIGGFKIITKGLDARADEIQRELDHAKTLRSEAETMLKSAERKQQEASVLAETIVRQAESDARSLMDKAEKDLTEMVVRREAQVEARIARAEEDATQEVKRVAADAATRAAAMIIQAHADKTHGADAFTTALGQAKSAL